MFPQHGPVEATFPKMVAELPGFLWERPPGSIADITYRGATARTDRRSRRRTYMARHGRHFGWRPDQPDHRDYYYGAPPTNLRALPPSVDLRGQMPPVYDQGRIGSCTANAIAGAIQFDRKKAGEVPDFV